MPLGPYETAYLAFRILLKELREKSRLTQSAVAERLSKPQSFVSKYETGERRLDLIETAEVCAALGVSVPHLLKELEARLKAQSAPAKSARTRRAKG